MESNIQQDMNALIKRRHEELEELKKGNHEAYAYSYDVTHYSQAIKDNYFKNNEVYKLLKDIDGIGEKRAKKILSNIQIVDLLDSIYFKNMQRLLSVKGIGKTIANKLIEHSEAFNLLKTNNENAEDVSIAGRIMAIRRMGKASFTHIQDKEGRIQIYLKKDDIGDEAYDVFKLLDIGDIIGVTGYVFKTKTGETSVHVKTMKLLAKSSRPIPIAKETTDEQGNKVIHDQFTDKELRYRQRYVDLIVNPEVKEVFILRSKIVTALRKYLDAQGYYEVETPVLQALYGGAAARPFITHHNTLDMRLYLRIADELYLKRLIVGGFDGVYEISKDFRNEGIDKTHNPEFTMLELYVAYKDYEWMMDFVESTVRNVAMEVFGTTKFTVEGNEVDFGPKWNRISMTEELKKVTGIDVLGDTTEEIKKLLKSKGVTVTGKESKGKLIDELFEITIQDKLALQRITI